MILYVGTLANMEVQISGCVFSSLFLELANSQGDIVSAGEIKIFRKILLYISSDKYIVLGRLSTGRNLTSNNKQC